MKEQVAMKQAREFAARGIAFDLWWTLVNGWTCRKKKVVPDGAR